MRTNVADFKKSLAAVKYFMHPALVQAMGIAQTLVVNHAKSAHEAPPGDGSHPSARYYDRTGNLTASIRQGEVRTYDDAIEGQVHAGGASAGGSVAYAPSVELGTKWSEGRGRHRAYPFLQPALDAKKQEILAVFADALRKVL